MAYSTISYGGVTLNVVEINEKIKVPGTIKQTFGGELVKIDIPGKAKEWRVRLTGQISGASKDTERSNLEALDDAKPHDFSDGFITTKMIIEDLTFQDSGEFEATVYNYQLSLIEFNQ